MPSAFTHIFDSSSVRIQLANTLAALGGAFYLRRTPRSVRVLGVLDVVFTLGICTVWAVMILEDEGKAEPNIQLVSILATSQTLATRAALLPSTPGRSALIGGGGFAPILPVAYHLGSLAYPGHGLRTAIYAMTWAIVGIAATTAITYVIYGLRMQVRQAMQLGQYHLEEKIGEGGMGVVYRASHAMLRRPCAIKLLSGATEGSATNRFQREVQITAQLTHPNTVVVFDYGKTPDGVFFYAMEYLVGITLEDLVIDFGPQPPSRVVHILLQACGALDEAHANGLVHRDIKPSNIMLTERGRVLDTVKVLDFGLVREAQNADAAVSNVNAILGTPYYMAPEAVLDPASVDARTDLYALGATAYFLLTGKHVFAGNTVVEVLAAHVHQTPAPPSKIQSGVPPLLDELVLECLAKKPTDRPASAAVLMDLLRACGVDAWSPSAAKAFWDQPAVKESGQRAKAKPPASVVSPFDNTLSVSLEGRRRAMPTTRP